MINNRAYRQKVLKELIMKLHDGESVESVKEQFAKLIEGVTATEISEMEQGLISDGMPVEEVQRLCDVHASVFKGTIDEVHQPQELFNIPGHPLNTFTRENEAIENFILNNLTPHLEAYKNSDAAADKNNLVQNLNELWDLDKHYSRKENLLFPYLEKAGITAPPKVMWGVDDEIRGKIKEIKTMVLDNSDKDIIYTTAIETFNKINDMIFKEKNILFPMAIDNITEDEWINIYDESDEVGYCLIAPEGKWVPKRVDVEEKESEGASLQEDVKGYVKFDTGILSFAEINAIFNTLPFDITFIDKDDIVKYFSQGKDRIFVRTKAVIGRNVQNCHPPSSVNIVDQIVSDFKSGAKDTEHFWIPMGEWFVYIQYFAVRDEKGEYIGVMEVTQDIKPIQAITGEKRLLAE